jgi:hypothetical protein
MIGGASCRYRTCQLVTIRSLDNDGRQPFALILWSTDPDDTSSWTAVERIDSGRLTGTDANDLGRLRFARSDALNIAEKIDAAIAALDEGS